MSETASFVDPVFLARFGLSRLNALDYFLHPLNPFRTSATTSNEILAMQGIGIGTLMQQGGMFQQQQQQQNNNNNTAGPAMLLLTPGAAEHEYATALTRLNGEQYELLPPPDGNYTMPSPLYSIRHVLRSNPTTTKVLGIYTIVEGVIYKAPSVRALMKTHVARTLQGLSDACSALSVCARYLPSTGYTWKFEPDEDDEEEGVEEEDDEDNAAAEDDNHVDGEFVENRRRRRRRIKEDPVVALLRLTKRNKRRKILDTRPAGERSAAEEEGIRAAEAMEGILVRLSKSNVLAKSNKNNNNNNNNNSKTKHSTTASNTSVPLSVTTTSSPSKSGSAK